MSNVKESRITPVPASGYAAFYYEWENITTNMKYGGYHVGDINDKYKHTSKNPQMMSDFDNMGHEWIHSVLFYGSKEQMQDKERSILKSNDARRSDDWYNLTNGGSPYDLVGDEIITIRERILNGEWIQPEYLQQSDIKKALRDAFQPRVNHSEPKFTKLIETLIDDKGDTSNTNPLTFLEGKDGKIRLINGNTTARAVLDSKHGTKVKYQIVPFKEVKNFSPNDIRALGLALNPKDKKPTNPTNVPDAVAYVVEAFISGNRPIEHQSNIDYLQDVLNFSSRQRKEVIKEVKAQFTLGAIQSNSPLVRYAQKANKYLLKDRVKQLESKLPNTKVFAYATSMVRYGDIVTWLMGNDKKAKNEKIANVMLLVHFSSYTDIKKWKAGESLLNSDRMSSLCSKYGLGWREIEEMDKY